MSDPVQIQLKKFKSNLSAIFESVQYSELYGYDLKDLADSADSKDIVILDRLLQKFLTANKFNIDESISQLSKTLAWRKEFNPLSAAFEEVHDSMFEKLGVITSVVRPGWAPSAPLKEKELKEEQDKLTNDKNEEDAAIAATTIAKDENDSSVESVAEDEANKKEQLDTSESSNQDDSSKKSVLDAENSNAHVISEPNSNGSEGVNPQDVNEVVASSKPNSIVHDSNESEQQDDIAESSSKNDITSNDISGSADVNPEEAPRSIVTWNLYGAIKDRATLFSDLNKFLRWRIGLMERGISLLDFSKPETSYVTQVHDYQNAMFSFLGFSTKAGTKATVQIFQNYYPEVLDYKYFVNVPVVMNWAFNLAKVWTSKATFEKFRVISNGSDLASQLGSWVPKQYGGSADGLDEIEAKDYKRPSNELFKRPTENQQKLTSESTETPSSHAEKDETITAAPESVSQETSNVVTADKVPEKQTEQADTEPITSVPANATTTEEPSKVETSDGPKPGAVANEENLATSTSELQETPTITATSTTNKDGADNLPTSVGDTEDVSKPKPGAVPTAPRPTDSV